MNKELHTKKKKKMKSSIIETKFDKFGNKVSIKETSNEVYKGKVTNEKNISLSRDTIASFLSGIMQTSDKHEILFMIKSDENPQKDTGNLKDDTFFD